jgi:hypothetical protein
LRFFVLHSSWAVGFWCGLFFLVLEEEGNAALAHLLPAGFVGNCTLTSASPAGCRQVEAKTTSRKPKTANFKSK